ncbi:CsgE family curli-type amyloid fiber assembly protein [Spiribacter sp. 218]|uniref:CsgE family curli-type amyloid fiber assembly protein n=1 Tax=Spiribacter pallidus TaxID=1987936 RepID=UPI00349F8956
MRRRRCCALLAGAGLVGLWPLWQAIGQRRQADGLEDPTPLEAPPPREGGLENDGLNNMVIQRTVTALGDRFYDAFANHWRNQSVIARGVIGVEESPWMSEGTEIIIRFRREVIYRIRVWPRNPGPEERAATAVREVSRIIDRYQTRLRPAPD